MKLFLIITSLIFISCDSPPSVTVKSETAILSSGCFWGLQHLYREVPGVLSTHSGFTGGSEVNPTYYSAKKSGHIEAVEIIFDPKKISYKELIQIFFDHYPPKLIQREGHLKGIHFRGRIFTMNKNQDTVAQELSSIYDTPLKAMTEIKSASAFYPAEELHQDWHFKRGKLPAQSCQMDD